MAINLYIRLTTKSTDFENLSQYYKEKYFFQATGDEANEPVKNYRFRHFLTASTPNSTVSANTGLIVYDGTSITNVTGSYNDWTTPYRPPKLGDTSDESQDYSQFNTELIMRFDVDRTVDSMPANSEAWITVPFKVDNGTFVKAEVEHSFSFLGYSDDPDYIKNPLNVVLEHKVDGGEVGKISTVFNTLPSGVLPTDCRDTEHINELYAVETVLVETKTPHNLHVGDSVTLYSKSVSAAEYMGNTGRMFGKAQGERYLGDFTVTSVPSANSFTYNTCHNLKLINKSNCPEYSNVDGHSDWTDLVWEKWEMYEYSESVSATATGSSVVFTYNESAPSSINCKHNFAIGDNVAFVYNTSEKTHLVVTAVAQDGSNITAEPVDGESVPSGITTGTLVYTSRLPSSDIAFNVRHSDIAPPKVKSHSKESTIIYACQDTYYESNTRPNESNGSSKTLSLARETVDEVTRDTVIPILKFPIPRYYGDATVDPDMVSKLYVYAKSSGGVSNNKIYITGWLDKDWSESETNRAIGEKYTEGSIINDVSKFGYENQSRSFENSYVQFSIKNEYIIQMLKGTSYPTFVLHSEKLAHSNDPIKFASREDDEAFWPYIAINSPKFIARNPTISLSNTYMYLICDSIHVTENDDETFVATVTSKMFDNESLMYVRSWNSDTPFFAVNDEIEIMNTVHYNTVTAKVTNVDYNEHTVYFKYTKPTEYMKARSGSSEYGIIRNRSRMISTYTTTDAENNPSNLTINGPAVKAGPFGYEGLSLEFDVIHDDEKSTTSLSAVYSDGDFESNTETPVIITDMEVTAKSEEGHDHEVDRFMHVGPNNSVILKGFNLNTLSDHATAVLGSGDWEDGIGDGVPAQLSVPDSGNTAERQFDYNDTFDLQRVMPVYAVQNDANGVTEFKVLDSVGHPFVFSKGDIVAAIFTGIYAEDYNVPQGTKTLKYGVNYYIADAPRTDENDSDYVWIRLSSSYIFRGSEQSTPDYVKISSEDVGHINDKIPSSGPLTENNVPLVIYSTVTSVSIKDGNSVDTSYNYANRLYLQIDEEPPVCYVPDEHHIAGVPFPVYISDLNEIDNINGQPLSTFNPTYILPNEDARFIKLELRLNSNTTLFVYDAAGNCTPLTFDVTAVDFDLAFTKIVTDGTTHTLSFEVSDSEESLLSTAIAAAAGEAGIYATLGTNAVNHKITNISSISQYREDRWRFTFDLVLTNSEVEQSNGELKVFAGDTNTDEFHQSRTWQEPIIFKKEDDGCVRKGDVLKYLGVNLIEPTGKTLGLLCNPQSAFSIVRPRPNPVTANNISITVNKTGLFCVQWSPDGVSPAIVNFNYMNRVNVTYGPTISIKEESKNISFKKGTQWKVPWDDITAKDGSGNDISPDDIQVTVKNESDVDVSDTDWWNVEGKYTVIYTTPSDGCNRDDSTASVESNVLVTLCGILIIMTKDVYDPYEDIEILISPESTVLFNQNWWNNTVYYMLPDSGKWVQATLLSGTEDRKKLTILNPHVIASGIQLYVDVGEDNIDAEANCVVTQSIPFAIESKEEQDKELDVDGKASIVKRNSKGSRFDDLNFEPIYNKDLSYSSFTITADENSLMQNVYSILLTNLGERLYDDEFGSTLEESVFDIIGDLNGESKLLNQCVTLINKYEPRAVVVEDKSYVAINEDNTVVIILYIKVPRGVARKIELTFRKNA